MAVDGYEKRTLLEKYEIPIDHLTFEYLEKCNDPRELERIVKILRSGEEGSYPDLLKSFETKLARVMPGSRLLKVSQTAVTTRDNGYDFYMKTINEIKEFRREAELFREEVKNKPRRCVLEELPPVRSPGKITFSQREGKTEEPKKLRTEPKKLKSGIQRNYSEWEKYDVDRELVRMDIEEERARERSERKQKQKPVKEEEVAKVHIADGGGDYEYTHAEKVYMASQQKDRGNEYYRAGDHKQAIEHYSAAIVLDPTPAAYNNRALAYLKLQKYAEAISDCNKVLEVEPDNLKALMRRGVAYESRSDYQKALEDFTKVTILQPNNQKAHNLARQMQEKIGGRKKAVRMKIEEDGPVKRGNKVLFKPWGSSVDRNVEYNEFGLPKVICTCSGEPAWVRNYPAQQYPDTSSDDEYPCEPASESMETSETEEYSSSSVTSRLRDDSDSQVDYTVKQEKSVINNDFEIEKGSGDMYSKEKTEDNGSDVMSFSDGIEPLTIHEVDFNSLLPEGSEPGEVPMDNTCRNWQEEPMQEAEGIEDLSLEDNAACKITSVCEFINAWQSVKNKNDPLQLAPVLRRIRPSDLPQVIGNSMDGPMLCTMLQCLEKAFLHDPAFVLDFLKSITSVTRFTLVKCFLGPTEKEVISRLFAALEKVGCHPPADLQKAFLS
ncbi:RNA polymerase II-associated protein 3 isoform X1 [Anabrus simplex]|uniref:RNA polymerase II-associated protein 3 isoform X1 n=1 Tax=Anabrus simplex TaxID=316456 RepID=UPI0035A32482